MNERTRETPTTFRRFLEERYEEDQRTIAELREQNAELIAALKKIKQHSCYDHPRVACFTFCADVAADLLAKVTP
jgi:hypothetical protein